MAYVDGIQRRGMKLTLKEWAQATGGEMLTGDPGIYVGGDRPGGLSIDTRTLSEGDWFAALIGKTGVDGHQYLDNAVCKGAAGVIVSNREEYQVKVASSYPDLPALLVNDTTLALGDAARALLEKFKPFVIAITGTVGKTSVKEAVAHIASRKWPTLKTLHNWNTEIGLPLTVFEIKSEHKVVVLECATRGPGQISYLSMIARPDIAVVISIGPGHLSEFGSVDDVAGAKWEIIDGLKKNGIAVASSDPWTGRPYIEKFAGDVEVLTFGTEPDSDFIAQNIIRTSHESEFDIVRQNEKPLHASIPGTSHADVMNALTAVAICSSIKIQTDRGMETLGIDEIIDALRTLPSTPGRLETIVRESGIEVIFDGYNSNPLSLENAIDAWSMRTKLHNGQPVKRHVAILGDMLELGENEIEYHRKAGETIAEQLLKDGILITVGQLASHIRSRAGEVMIGEIGKHGLKNFDAANPTGGKHFDTTDECASELENYLRPGDLVLIKASRSLAFEKLLAEEW